MTGKLWPYLTVFLSSLAVTAILTPLVREINRHFGMVDKPDPRRINKVPIPRGGGVAIVIGVIASFFAVLAFVDSAFGARFLSPTFVRITILAVAIAVIGLLDDRFSLNPKVKLAGQFVVAALAWGWAGIGFSGLWPSIPVFLDAPLTIFWILGAVNAFNLIDGLDGLASGLALIATLGMAGALVIFGKTPDILWHLAFAGGLLGFLCYNYNPASVFLGDSGSMFIGFVLAIMPLTSQTPNSFLVSVGVPLLAMGVPIFDTALAILRRSLRRLINYGEKTKAGEVMTADTDHLHHRILRSVGFSQRKAAWALYSLAIFFVLIGLILVNLESQRAGLWLVAITVASIVIFRDMSRIEIYDAGRLLSHIAHDRDLGVRRRISILAVPFYVFADVVSLVGTFFIIGWISHYDFTRTECLVELPIRVVATFICLMFFRVYRTVWSRAMLSNFVRLFLATLFGAIIGTLGVFFAPNLNPVLLKAKLIFYTFMPFSFMVLARIFRDFVRDLFYAIDCARLKGRKDVSRILVYGSGLRYRAFRRELVRTTANNSRIIVGILDDDILLRNHFIGGIQILGTINEAPELIVKYNVDAVVIACQLTREWMTVVRKILTPTGVKVSFFDFKEEEE